MRGKGLRCHTHPVCSCDHLANTFLGQGTNTHPFPLTLLLIKRREHWPTLNFIIIRKTNTLSQVFSTIERRKPLLSMGITNASDRIDSV